MSALCQLRTSAVTSKRVAAPTHGKQNANQRWIVRFGSKADMVPIHCDVRFAPISGHWLVPNTRPMAFAARGVSALRWRRPLH